MSDGDGQNLRQFRARATGAGHGAGDTSPMTGTSLRRMSAPTTRRFAVPAELAGPPPGDHVDDLLAAYALGALDDDERLAVDRHAAFCPECARLLAETRRTAAMLPFVAAPASPSPDVKAALFTRIAQSQAPVTAEQADEYAWARPVAPRRATTLPASGSWVESLATAEPSPVTEQRVPRSRRRRPGIVAMVGMTAPVALVFGLLAVLVLPGMLSRNQNGDTQLAQLLSNPTTCVGNTDTRNPLIVSPSIKSACGILDGAGSNKPGTLRALLLFGLQNDAAGTLYVLYAPTSDRGYLQVGQQNIIPSNGSISFEVPDHLIQGRPLCLALRGDDPNVVCSQPATPEVH